MRLEKKDLFLLVPATLLAIAGLGPDDPWVVGPCLFLSWLTFIIICVVHEGSRKARVGIAILITLALGSVGYRRFHSIFHSSERRESNLEPETKKEPPPEMPPTESAKTTKEPSSRHLAKPKSNSPEAQQPLTILQAPSYGNLKKRAFDLADAMTTMLCSDGWRDGCPVGTVALGQIPQTADGSFWWNKTHSNMFRGKFLPHLIELRDDFARRDFKDDELDEAIKRELFSIQESDRRKADAAAKGHPISYSYIWDILPQEIEMMAERLRVLGNQVPSN